MNEFLSYIFWPNPANAEYTSPKAIVLLAVCIVFILASFIIPRWRNRMHNPQLKKISGSWAKIAGWFGWIGLFLVIARVEEIQYVSMRFMWVLWGLALLALLFIQFKIFRAKYYEVIPNQPTSDDRAKYLPKKKR